MPASAQQLNELNAVNQAINAIPYDALPGKGEGYDTWIDDPVPGDAWVCRDYVLKKGKLLAGAAWPSDSMTIVTCWTEPVSPVANPDDPTSGREYHAVLAVAVEGTIYILDSRADAVYEAAQPQESPHDYLWWRQQDPPGTTQCRDATGGLT
jgi:predicted transglutaminase-like cysteine proteinase